MKFQSVIQLGGKTATGIPVPAEVVEQLGDSKRPKVVVAIGSYSYRSSIAPMNGLFLIPVSAEHRQGAGVEAGDAVEVEVTLDDSPREVVIPVDFAEALSQNAEAKAAFDRLSYSKKQQYTLPIEQAKTPETRQRRIEKAVAALQAERE